MPLWNAARPRLARAPLCAAAAPSVLDWIGHDRGLVMHENLQFNDTLTRETPERSVGHEDGSGNLAFPAISDEPRRNRQLPSSSEQRAVADNFDRETAKIDAPVANERETIDRLEELRTALISAAVTGNIDVREAGT